MLCLAEQEVSWTRVRLCSWLNQEQKWFTSSLINSKKASFALINNIMRINYLNEKLEHSNQVYLRASPESICENKNDDTCSESNHGRILRLTAYHNDTIAITICDIIQSHSFQSNSD